MSFPFKKASIIIPYFVAFRKRQTVPKSLPRFVRFSQTERGEIRVYIFKFGFIGGLGLSGVQGRSPCTAPRWPGVSGAAVSAPTRGGSRKKIGYNKKHTRQWILQKSIGSPQFSCTYRCAPRRSGPPSALPAVVFRSRGLRPLDPQRCCKGNVGSLTPLNCDFILTSIPPRSHRRRPRRTYRYGRRRCACHPARTARAHSSAPPCPCRG